MKEAALPHVHVLENETFIWNQTRFICATGWTDFSSSGNVVAATQTAWDWMNDFRVIRTGENYRRLRPSDLINRNHASFAWLSKELDEPFNGKTVVVTHHAPIAEVMGDKHEGHLSAAYSNRWHELLDKADLWVFGHTHRAVDITLHGCRVVSNPKGYPGEQTGFDPGFVIDLPYPECFSSAPLREIGCLPGWLNLIDELCRTLKTYLDAPPEVPQIQVRQVKEKFGGLRFYFSGGDAACREAVITAEQQSMSICEVCGQTGTLGGERWLSVRCSDHLNWSPSDEGK